MYICTHIVCIWELLIIVFLILFAFGLEFTPKRKSNKNYKWIRMLLIFKVPLKWLTFARFISTIRSINWTLKKVMSLICCFHKLNINFFNWRDIFSAYTAALKTFKNVLKRIVLDCGPEGPCLNLEPCPPPCLPVVWFSLQSPGGAFSHIVWLSHRVSGQKR